MPLSEGQISAAFDPNTNGVLAIGATQRVDSSSIATTRDYSRAIFSPFSENIFVGFQAGGDGAMVAMDTVRAKGLLFANAYLANGNVADINVNYQAGGGLLVLSSTNNGCFSSDTEIPATAIWTDITPPPATSRNGIFSLRGDSNLYTMTATLTIPNRNIEISGDGGASWDSNPGAFIDLSTGTGSLRGPVVGPGGNVVAMWNAGAGSAIAFLTDPSAGLPGAGNFEITGITTTISFGDFNSDGDIFVCRAGQFILVITAAGFTTVSPANNPFNDDNAGAVQPNMRAIKFSPQLNGWVFITRGLTTGPEQTGFMSADDTTVIVANECIENDGSCVTDQVHAMDVNGDVIGFGNNLSVVRTNLF